MAETVFHVQLRQFPNSARAYNLSRAELEQRFTRPWASGLEVATEDRKWTPDKARLTIYESRPLRADEIAIGRGWGNVERVGADVTERELAAVRSGPAAARPAAASLALAAVKDELVSLTGIAPIPVSRAVSLARIAAPGARASERLAVAEQAVWELLHERRIDLARAGAEQQPLPAAEWEQLMLSWTTWTKEPPELLLIAGGSGDMTR
ncbi:MAG TPA: hypothetical protein VGX45_11740 [Solirubrobacteraceae bacterium]|jgi:hypothetical protein|nr:hypothetical protein [Solirubrobacteraceae bacterium]